MTKWGRGSNKGKKYWFSDGKERIQIKHEAYTLKSRAKQSLSSLESHQGSVAIVKIADGWRKGKGDASRWADRGVFPLCIFEFASLFFLSNEIKQERRDLKYSFKRASLIPCLQQDWVASLVFFFPDFLAAGRSVRGQQWWFKVKPFASAALLQSGQLSKTACPRKSSPW